MIKKYRNNIDQLLGVVLCGGMSSRMGADKGLLPLNDSIWARVVGAKMEALKIPVVYSISPEQVATYTQHISIGELIVDSSQFDGPLKGLLSVYAKFPSHDFMLMACDMLDILPNTLQLLLHAYLENDDDFFAFRKDEYFEPLCAIYTGKGLQGFLDGDIKSLQSILQNGKTKSLQAGREEYFNNYNDLP